METFKGRVHQVTESVLTPRRRSNDLRSTRMSMRMSLLFDAEGHLLEELYRDRNHANRTTYKYNKRGNCVEQNEFNTEHRLARRYLFKYDRWGNRVEEQGYDAQGSLQQTLIHRYNEQGEELEKRLRRGESNDKMEYRFDAQGHVVEECKTLNGKFVLRRTYGYDSHGQKTVMTQTDSDNNEEKESYEYVYDDSGRIVEERVLDSHDLLSTRYTFAYDDVGRITDRKQNDDAGHFRGSHDIFDAFGNKKETWWYDNENHSCGHLYYVYDGTHLIEETMLHGTLTASCQDITTEGDGVVQKMYYTGTDEHKDYYYRHSYYDDGQLKETMEEHYDENGVVVQRMLRQYDTLGNLLRDQQNETSLQYQYDANSNWVKRTRLFEGDVMEIVTRVITYYS